VGLERIVKKVNQNIYPCFDDLCLDMDLSNRCFYHFCRKSAIEKDLIMNFFPSKMEKFLLDITEGWLEFKKIPIQ
jgi:hypothetical protein